MNIITDIEQANILLSKYKGGSLQIDMYSTSLRKLAIKIKSKDVLGKIVFFVGVGCVHLDGYFDFYNIDLNIEHNSDNELFTLIDKSRNFKLITNGGFSLAEGFEQEFNDTLEELIP